MSVIAASDEKIMAQGLEKQSRGKITQNKARVSSKITQNKARVSEENNAKPTKHNQSQAERS